MYAYPSPVRSTEPMFPQELPAPAARFSPRPFGHNSRVAAALLPSLAVLASYGGSQVAAVLVVSSGMLWIARDAESMHAVSHF
jgi:hypothetical protein